MVRSTKIKGFFDEVAASLVEYLLILSLVTLVAVSAVPPLRWRIEAYIWFAYLVLGNNTYSLENGIQVWYGWAPYGAFRIWSNIDPPGAWCYIKFTSDPKTPQQAVEQGDIQYCTNAPNN